MPALLNKTASIIGFFVFTCSVFFAMSLHQSQSAQASQLKVVSNLPMPKPGKPLCGGIINGRLQDKCNEFKPATLQGQAIKKCPSGQFRDLGTGACWSCPSGYNRTGLHIVKDADRACAQTVKPDFASAKFLYKPNHCPPGSLRDPRNGGECWSCPNGYERTLRQVTHAEACFKGPIVGRKFAPAKYRGKPAKQCGNTAQNFRDPRKGGECWSCPEGYDRTLRQVTHGQACNRPAYEKFSQATFHSYFKCSQDGQFMDLIDGGTCWSCPPMYTRTARSVKHPQACTNTSLGWELSPRSSYRGLFSMPGALDISRELLKDPEHVQEILKVATENSELTFEEIQQVYEDEMKEPHESPILASMVLVTALDAYNNDAMSAAEQAFISALTHYVKQTRVIIANEALAMYENWLAARIAEDNTPERKITRGMTSIYDLGYRPPDMSSLAEDLIRGGAEANPMAMSVVGVTTAIASSSTITSVFGGVVIASYAGNSAVTTAFKVLSEATMLLMKKSATGVVGTAGGGLATVTGPAIAAVGFAIIASVAIDHAYAASNARSELQAKVRDAENAKIDLKEMLKTPTGAGEIIFSFASMIQSDNPRKLSLNQLIDSSKSQATSTADKNSSAVADSASSSQPIRAAFNLNSNWLKVKSWQAADIAAGPNNSVFYTQKRDNTVWKWNRKANKWDHLGLGFTQIDVDPTGNVMGIKPDKTLQYFDGSKYRVLPGKAEAFGVGANGSIWHIGTNKRVYRWVNRQWQDTGASNAIRIDVGPDGNAWKINTRNDIYQYDGTRWVKKPGKAVDISIGADGTVMMVGMPPRRSPFVWKHNNWQRVKGKADFISVDNQGRPWKIDSMAIYSWDGAER